MTKPLITRMALALGSAAGLTAPALAQSPEQDAAQGAGLEEIVVTAQKRAENLQDVPVAISAFTGTTLERQQKVDIRDLSGQVPSLLITQSGAAVSSSQIALRGIAFQDLEKSFEPGVGVLIDGVYLSTSTGQLVQSLDFEQLEVLRGPQGTLFGKNTTGGALNITRTRPDPSRPIFGKVRATLGSFGRNDYEGVVSVPLIADVLAVKAAIFSLNGGGGFRQLIPGGPHGDKRYLSGTLALRATVDDVDIQLTYDHIRDKSDLGPHVSLISPETRPTGVPGIFNGHEQSCFNPFISAIACPQPAPFYRGKNIASEQFSSGKYILDAGTLNSKSTVGDFDLVSVTGLRHSYDVGGYDSDFSPIDLVNVWKWQHFTQVSEEFRVESNSKGPLKFVVGGYLFDSHYTAHQNVFVDLAALNTSLQPGTSFANSGVKYRQHARAQAIFAQADYSVTDRLTFTVGARQTWEKKTMRVQNRRYVGLFVKGPSIGEFQRTASFDKLTPRVAARYEVTPDLNVYASFSRGFNAGGFNGRSGFNPSLVGPYLPETIDSYEAGFKAEVFDRRLRINGAVFSSTLKDAQLDVAVPTPTPPFSGLAIANAGKERFRGAELEIVALPADGLNLSGSVGYLDAKYLSFDASLRPGLPVTDNSGLTPRRAPKWTASVNGDYAIDLGDDREIGFNSTARYISGVYLNLLNDPNSYQPKYIKVDASARYVTPIAGTKTQFTLFVRNLTNITPISSYNNGGLNSFQQWVTQDLRRQFGAEIQVKF